QPAPASDTTPLFHLPALKSFRAEGIRYYRRYTDGPAQSTGASLRTESAGYIPPRNMLESAVQGTPF
ncbi:hypothetical protein ACO22_07855, partial [Paracoccidioides brasiliensis]